MRDSMVEQNLKKMCKLKKIKFVLYVVVVCDLRSIIFVTTDR